MIVVTRKSELKIVQLLRFEFENSIRNFHGRVIPIMADASMLNLIWSHPFGYLQRNLFEDFTNTSLFSGSVNDFHHPLNLKCSHVAHTEFARMSSEPFSKAVDH